MNASRRVGKKKEGEGCSRIGNSLGKVEVIQVLQQLMNFESDKSHGKWQNLREKCGSQAWRNSLSKHSCALYMGHQQIAPGLQGNAQSRTFEDIHDGND